MNHARLHHGLCYSRYASPHVRVRVLGMHVSPNDIASHDSARQFSHQARARLSTCCLHTSSTSACVGVWIDPSSCDDDPVSAVMHQFMPAHMCVSPHLMHARKISIASSCSIFVPRIESAVAIGCDLSVMIPDTHRCTHDLKLAAAVAHSHACIYANEAKFRRLRC